MSPFSIPTESADYSSVRTISSKFGAHIGSCDGHIFVSQTGSSGDESERASGMAVRSLYEARFSQSAASQPQSGHGIPLLVLADRPNAFSDTHSSNHRSQDRLTRLHLCCVRDGLDIYNFSVTPAGFNLEDAGAKKRGSVDFLYIANRTND